MRSSIGAQRAGGLAGLDQRDVGLVEVACGCRARAAEKSSPPSTASFRSLEHLAQRRVRSPARRCRARAVDSVMPVSTMMANWLVT